VGKKIVRERDGPGGEAAAQGDQKERLSGFRFRFCFFFFFSRFPLSPPFVCVWKATIYRQNVA